MKRPGLAFLVVPPLHSDIALGLLYGGLHREPRDRKPSRPDSAIHRPEGRSHTMSACVKRHGTRWTMRPWLALVPLFVVASLALVRPAAAPYRGVLTQGAAFTIEVSNNINNTDKCAFTVLKISQRNRITDAIPVTVDLNTTGTLTDTAASSIDRVLIILDPPPAGPNGPPIVNVRVSQNNTVVSNDVYNGDVEIAYDVVP